MATTNHLPQEVKLLSSSTSNGEPTFPWKLHIVLEECERLGYSDIISWIGNNVIRVHDQKRFEEEIMKSYFKQQTKSRSFQRQCKCQNGSQSMICQSLYCKLRRILCFRVVARSKATHSFRRIHSESLRFQAREGRL